VGSEPANGQRVRCVDHDGEMLDRPGVVALATTGNQPPCEMLAAVMTSAVDNGVHGRSVPPVATALATAHASRWLRSASA
jgi:hypothetical protein